MSPKRELADALSSLQLHVNTCYNELSRRYLSGIQIEPLVKSMKKTSEELGTVKDQLYQLAKEEEKDLTTTEMWGSSSFRLFARQHKIPVENLSVRQMNAIWRAIESDREIKDQ